MSFFWLIEIQCTKYFSISQHIKVYKICFPFLVSHIPRDCSAILEGGQTKSGVYKISPLSTRHAICVYCDMETAGGGWTAFQRRLHWSVDFNRPWEDYKIGFGLPGIDYWIGNDEIHLLTKGNDFSLCVVIKLQNGTTLYELYGQFSIADEANKYKLFLGGPTTGTLVVTPSQGPTFPIDFSISSTGDSMFDSSLMNLNGMYFSTLDRDNDNYPNWDCGKGLMGGWWFAYCAHGFLNGVSSPDNFWGSWNPTVPPGSKVNETLMMIKPR
ncbi:fibroleukin-like [Ostrea edulis]|uniref:fibroleukin-like n=1 Tax=Ostrea edulis TaxID=37623 RepID=UPI0024AFDA2C|nr:fibroleukin-like [Ostrea edulis]